MTPEDALRRGKAFLDEATENLTFDAFDWAFEEVWHGVAWLLNALHPEPLSDIHTGEKGQLPQAGSLQAIYARQASPPPQARVALRLEALHTRVTHGHTLTSDDVADLIFEAWQLHDYCGESLNIADERLAGRLMLSEPSPGRIGTPVVARRTALKMLAAGALLPAVACQKIERDNRPARATSPTDPGAASTPDLEHPPATIKAVSAIDAMHWPTTDPFLFCAHHRDDYPEGNGKMGPAASLAGRHLGRDFDEQKPWRMYHGQSVPGFPRHPHRGFETVTVVRSGFLDHTDSMGATARYGAGDVQWLTSGRGIQHSEMFPLLRDDAPNPLELFQIWMNLPRADKMVDPHFTMLWNERIPRVIEQDAKGRISELTIAAGTFKGHRPPAPPPASWAARKESDVAIWSIRLEAGAQLELPEVNPGTLRSLYVHQGQSVTIAGRPIANKRRVEVEDPGAITLEGGPAEAEVLLLQGRPINEPIAQRGPFVMNTQDEIRQAYADYQRTQFGGWSFGDNGPVHEVKKGRFALHADGTFEEPV
nr:pirin family protein [Lujinxingia vulgaris]